MVERTVVGRPWSIAWSAVIVGGMSVVVCATLFGFIATGIGAQAAANAARVTSFSGIGLGGLIFAVIASFFAFVIGGWLAARIAGIADAPNAALYGALVWVVGMFLLLALASFGASFMSGWFSGLGPAPATAPAQPGTPVDPNVAKAARNAAVAGATAMLVGLIGAVIGGWMASDQPMTLRNVPHVRIETGRR